MVRVISHGLPYTSKSPLNIQIEFMIISCAIIDDEPLAAGLLESYAKKTPYLSLRGTYNSAIQAMKDLRENPVKLLFLDIQMPELSGIEFAKEFARRHHLDNFQPGWVKRNAGQFRAVLHVRHDVQRERDLARFLELGNEQKRQESCAADPGMKDFVVD